MYSQVVVDAQAGAVPILSDFRSAVSAHRLTDLSAVEEVQADEDRAD